MSFSKTYDKFVLLKKGKIQDREMGKAKMGIVINHSENIFLPQMIITKPEMEEKVEAFVKNGGTVIVTYRHAVKDADNNVPFGETLPVHYNALAGLTVEETEIRAYGKLSAEELNSYLEMTRKLTAALREETEKL